jgi:hypothetical protein
MILILKCRNNYWDLKLKKMMNLLKKELKWKLIKRVKIKRKLPHKNKQNNSQPPEENHPNLAQNPELN